MAHGKWHPTSVLHLFYICRKLGRFPEAFAKIWALVCIGIRIGNGRPTPTDPPPASDPPALELPQGDPCRDQVVGREQGVPEVRGAAASQPPAGDLLVRATG